MYADIRSFILGLIQGPHTSDYIYIGLIVYLISSFIVRKKWGSFVVVLVTAIIIKGMDMLLVGQSPYYVLLQFIHMILTPLLLTVFLKKSD